MGNYYDSGDPWDNDTSQVEYYAPNGYGLYDMAGNVWEWVEDDYHGSYDCDANPGGHICEAGGVAPTDGSAWVDDPRGTFRVMRGGGWGDNVGAILRLADRNLNVPHNADFGIGFRCAR